MGKERIHNEYGCSPNVPKEITDITQKIRDIIVKDYYKLLVSGKYDWSDMKLEMHEITDCALAEAHILAGTERRRQEKK